MTEFREWEDYEFEDSYLLRNKVGAVDFDALDEAERFFTRTRMNQLAQSPIVGNFDRAHMEAIHFHVFQDLYEWAGQVRVGGPMVKEAPDVLAGRRADGTRPWREYEYADTEGLTDRLDAVYDQLRDENHLRGLGQDQFTGRFAHYWATINQLHEFREGNTRSQTVFFDQLATGAGYRLDVAAMTTPQMRVQFVEARFHHQATGDSTRLAQVLAPVISKAETTANAASASAVQGVDPAFPQAAPQLGAPATAIPAAPPSVAPSAIERPYGQGR